MWSEFLFDTVSSQTKKLTKTNSPFSNFLRSVNHFFEGSFILSEWVKEGKKNETKPYLPKIDDWKVH